MYEIIVKMMNVLYYSINSHNLSIIMVHIT
jgi:hypothetical protein